MSETLPSDLSRLPLEAGKDLDAICERFEAASRGPSRPRIEDFLKEHHDDDVYPVLERELILLEVYYRRRDGEDPRLEEYAARFPKLERSWLESAFQEQGVGASDERRRGLETTLQGQTSDPVPAHPRYHVERTLGKGSFGTVYLARDEQLRRLVAIKVPHPKLVARPEDAEAYLTEARTVANLDHPHIVPVYDVGSTAEWPCFIVSKFIEGGSLAQKIKDSRPSFGEAAALVATIAEALHYAHGKGLVHRDIKPANVLIETSGMPFLVDFGLALKVENVGHGPKYAGTPAYMSPEQARGEGHRVDGRSDIFSLGVIFYELLAGCRPYPAQTHDELMEQVANYEPRPPRQIDDAIPKELERVCFKALSKRASERYLTAKDMADDLRYFLDQPAREKQALREGAADSAPTSPSTCAPTPATPRNSNRQPTKVVPKGLRSFDEHDADFFLELLPGPCDREGVPDSIRFWKTRIEDKAVDNRFSLGLIYGPSGCGKSSLVRAGLVPLLSDRVIVVFVEATPEETEARLLNGLRKKCPGLPVNLDLKETLAALRRGQGIPGAKKVLIILDQFEQWLHAKKEEQNTELVEALRQCNGEPLQCIALVRDEFWMAVTRFMRALEIRLHEDQNSAAVDLFPVRHAEKVLAAFGRAFGAFPENTNDATKQQKQFIEQVVSGLAQDGKVICVRLALFAEMMKGKPWSPASLKAVGGTGGVGITFLEETFSSASAQPEHRYHQQAARAVLKALLPESGSDIKGHMRSYAELLEASGYSSRPRTFDDLIRILDREIRLIMPTDPQGMDESGRMKDEKEMVPDSSFLFPPASLRYYQLTHDYLVHSVRDWLTRKQKETKQGRSELRLVESAAAWTAKPESRHIPAWWEWANIQLFTRKKNWTPSQRNMMRKAGRYHALRATALAVILALVGWAAYEGHGRLKAYGLRDRLLDANTPEVPTIVSEMASYRPWLDSFLRVAYQEAEAKGDARKQLHSSLALLPVDASQVAYLCNRLLAAQPHELVVIRDALTPHQETLRNKLWAVVLSPEKAKDSQRLRAAGALATYDKGNEEWSTASSLVVNVLVRENSIYLSYWSEAFRPVRNSLVAPLSAIFRDQRPERTVERNLATSLLADYAADNPRVLTDLLMDADDRQFAMIYPKLEERGQQTLPILASEINRKLPPDIKDEAKEKFAKRQANVAVALLKMGEAAKVWPLLKHSPDPRVRSYLIHRLGPLEADAKLIVKRLDEEPDITIQRALILSLGEFRETELSAYDRSLMVAKLQAVYRASADPGIHGASEWLLRTWKQEEWLKQVTDEWAKNREWQEKKLAVIKKELVSRVALAPAAPRWYVNGQGHTMVVIPGPVEFMMGSPVVEAYRRDDEFLHKTIIGRTFALASAPVTKEQFLRFLPKFSSSDLGYYPQPSCPIGNVSWFDAVAYCNWLSKEENIPEDQWCYEIKGPLTKVKENYLALMGYRLPMEAEMEYTARAGAVTSRYFGETEELLPMYAWYDKNSQQKTWPVGTKKPNDLGLFDVQGNVYLWCQDRYKKYSQTPDGNAVEDNEDDVDINKEQGRALRGASFANPALDLRSAVRFVDAPTFRLTSFGFRVARTLPLTHEGDRK